MGLEAGAWVVVTTVQGQLEEAQIRSFLEAHEVPTQVRGETLRSTHGLTVDGLGAVQILVRRTDVARARTLLDKAEGGELTVDELTPEAPDGT